MSTKPAEKMSSHTVPPAHSVEKIQHPRQVLASGELIALNQRSNLKGALRLTGHLCILLLSGYLWATLPGWLRLPALLVYGISLAMMFCTVHECVHRTAFANSKTNDVVGWFAGLLSFYNSTFYRRYHTWHHRYTQVPGKDPELEDPNPETLTQYLWQLSGILWWKGKIEGHFKVATGQLDGCPFLPEQSYEEVIRSTRLQLGVYAAIALATTALDHPWFLIIYWVLPLALGQPLLRFVLLAEHTGCTNDNNPLTNTRTTLTLPPLRYLMWNMPYHAEHHLYPSIPFHSLPLAHQKLQTHFSEVASGYLKVNQAIVKAFN
jgi:fatty acid desaturase